MEQFVIAGFDKDGPGDFGRQVSLSDEEQAELLQLLDIESWEACEGIEHGLSVCLTVADKELQHFLSVQDEGEEGSVILLLDQTSGERWLYRASEQTAKQAEQLAARLRARCDEK